MDKVYNDSSHITRYEILSQISFFWCLLCENMKLPKIIDVNFAKIASKNLIQNLF